MILFQVRDLAAKTCGEPHIAPSWEIAKASLGAMLAKTPELAERARSIRIEYLCEFNPEFGPVGIPGSPFSIEDGDICLKDYRDRCLDEEQKVQAEADNGE